MVVEDQNIENNAENTEQVETSQENNFTAKIVESSSEESSWFEAKEDVVEEVKEVVEEVKSTEVVETTEVVTEEKPNEEVATQENVQAVIDETAVLNFLKEKGITAEKLEDLKPKEVKQLTPEVEKFLEFKEKTGNSSFTDFLATQKDWSQEPKETILLENLKAENPTLNDKQIEFLYKRTYEFDEDIDEEDFIMEREINIERDYQKGLKLLESRKEEFMVPRGSDESIPEDYRIAKTTLDNYAKQQEEDDKLFQENRNDYVTQTEKIFTDNFEGFKVKVGNEKTGFEELTIKPENISEAKKAQSDLNNFNNKFFDPKNGKLIDSQGFHKALYFGMNADKIAEHFYNLGKAKLAEEEDKLSKNITTESARNIPGGNSNITVKVVQ
jgi:hypothetical protein